MKSITIFKINAFIFMLVIGIVCQPESTWQNQAFAEDDTPQVQTNPSDALDKNYNSSESTDDIRQLKNQVEEMNERIKKLQEKIASFEEKELGKSEEIKELAGRLSKAEIHTATDKVLLGIELRTRAETIRYKDVMIAPPALMNGFFVIPPNGFNGATLQQIQMGMANMAQAGMVPKPEKYNAQNDIVFTNKFRLEMRSKISDNLNFGGRMAMYKAFGDSTGIKFNGGSMNDVTFDGNTSSLPHGDTIRLERAYFNYNHPVGNVPVNISFGRRPSTEGPPFEYRNFSKEGGSALESLINWQFDGISLNLNFEGLTKISGASLKLCYGVAFEGDWGNSSSLSFNQPSVDDVHMLGFISTLYDDGFKSIVLNYAHAWNITDGFTGLTVMPFIVSKQDTNNDGQPEYFFAQNSGGYISRIEPSSNIGDWDAGSILFRSNLSDMLSDIDIFMALSLSHTKPSQISKNPFYEIMGQGLLSSGGKLESHTGYNLYTGIVFPMPYDAKFGIEYNQGSKYWFNFTGAEDSLIGSKVAARGQVFEGYYTQPVHKTQFFINLGGRYYDYAYTGSGIPLGEPIKIKDVKSFDALNSVADKVWLGYLSATLRF